MELNGLNGDGCHVEDDGDETVVSCAYCGAESSIEDAMENGWEPDFWLTETKHVGQPCCGKCSAEHLTDFDNDPIIKGPDHVPPGMSLDDRPSPFSDN